MAGLKQETKKIGAHTYRVTQLGFGKGREMLQKLIKLTAPVAAAAVGGVASTASLKEIVSGLGPNALADLLRQIGAQASAPEIAEFFEVFGKSAQLVEGGREQYLDEAAQELLWAGAYGEAFEFLVFALEVNYRDFFVGLNGRLGGDLRPAVAAA